VPHGIGENPGGGHRVECFLGSRGMLAVVLWQQDSQGGSAEARPSAPPVMFNESAEPAVDVDMKARGRCSFSSDKSNGQTCTARIPSCPCYYQSEGQCWIRELALPLAARE
jgi:hypothetical protein